MRLNVENGIFTNREMGCPDQIADLLRILTLRGCFQSAFQVGCLFILAFVSGSKADLLQSVSVRNSSLSLPSVGNSDSVAPQISADGRFVLFSSSANNLVSGDNGQFGLDLFLRDRASNATILVSDNFTDTGGGKGNSVFGQISTNGQYVVFQSDASDLLPGDTNGVSDIFVRDLQTGYNTLVSVAINGGWANGASTEPLMTPDGRYVAFISAATNLVAGDTNAIPDVFVRDLISQTTTLVSTGAFGASSIMAESVITPDGRRVAFSSTAKGLAPGVSAASKGEIYVRDLVAGTTTWVSTNTAALVSSILHLNNMPSYHPTLSDDGNYVAFKTGWTNGAVAPNLPGVAAALIFRYDFTAGSNSLVAMNSFPRWPYLDDIYGPEMTPDGRFIAFVATNYSPVSSTSVQLWDAQTGTNITVSVGQDGSLPTKSSSDTPVMSPDGRFVAFLSSATNLTGSVISNGFHIYLRDLLTGMTQLVDADTNGIGSSDNFGAIPSLSADGKLIALDSSAGNLTSGDNNQASDIFVRDTIAGTNELISLRDSNTIPQTADNFSSLGQFSLSADGRWIAFASYADDLVSNDTNDASDVFVTDLFAGTNALVSASVGGSVALGGFSASPVISGNGRFVVFTSTATNLLNGQTNFYGNLFLSDLQAGTNSLVSVSTNGISPGNGDSTDAVISQNGRYVSFLSKAHNLATGLPTSVPNTFWRDLNSGITVSLAGTSAAGNSPTMSADGRYVAYFRQGSQLWVWDSHTNANIYTNTSLVTSAALSPTGTQLVYQVAKKIFVYDLIRNTNIFSIASTPAIAAGRQWSSDGRYLTFVTSTNAALGDSNGTNDVYLCDFSTGMLTLISLNNGHAGSASGPSDSPAISGDGRFVVYRSFATDIVAGATSPPPNIFLYDRLTGSNSLVSVVSSAPTNWSSFAFRPAINGDGSTVVFENLASGLVPNDLNREQDVFADSLTPVVPTDTDGDKLPDWWMLQYFGHPTGDAGDNSRAQDDADGDGMSNLQEYLTGTNPRDSTSVFRLQIAAMISTNTMALTWISVPGGSYQIQYKDNLTDPVWLNLPGNPTVTGNQGCFMMPPSQSSRYYRIVEEN
jgi:WD40-like Beta Propeller Repeat